MSTICSPASTTRWVCLFVKDRVTMLPQSLIDALNLHLKEVRAVHDVELAAGRSDVELPFALARKYPRTAFASGWQVEPCASTRPAARIFRPCASPAQPCPQHHQQRKHRQQRQHMRPKAL